MLALTGLNRLHSQVPLSRSPSETISTLSTYDLNFVADTYKGGAISYTDNNTDRLYRQMLRYAQPSYVLKSDGSYQKITTTGKLRRSDMGLWIEQDRTNIVLYNRDMTNAAWVKTNITAAKTQTGVDTLSNSASSITATAPGATIIQAITQAATTCFSSFFVKRLVGAGTLEYTLDGGTTWISATVTSGWTRISIGSASLTNPSVGFRIGTSGNSFAIDFVQIEYGNGGWTANTISNPIEVTSAAVRTWGDRYTTQTSDSNTLCVDIGAGGNASTVKGFYIEFSAARLEDFNAFTNDSPTTSGGKHVKILAANGSVVYGNATTGAGQFNRGWNYTNKIAGYTDANGYDHICCNGNAVAVSSTARTLTNPSTHWDLCCNGAGSVTSHGYIRRVAFFGSNVLTDADLRDITA